METLQHNLTTALYSAEPNGSQLVEIALQLRIDRFAERIKIQIDKDAYKQWLSGSGSIQPRLFSDHILAQEVIGEVGVFHFYPVSLLPIFNIRSFRRDSIKVLKLS